MLAAILSALSGVYFVVLTIMPIIVTVAKVFPKIFAFLRGLFGASRGAMGKSGILGLILSVVGIGGGIGWFVVFILSFDFQIYLKILDVVLTPFSFVLKSVVQLFVNSIQATTPLNKSVLALMKIFNWDKIVSLLMLGFACEFYIRLLTINLIRRGK